MVAVFFVVCGVGVTTVSLFPPTHPAVITTATNKTMKRRYFIPVLSFE
jgi:hypothetical protein